MRKGIKHLLYSLGKHAKISTPTAISIHRTYLEEIIGLDLLIQLILAQETHQR